MTGTERNLCRDRLLSDVCLTGHEHFEGHVVSYAVAGFSQRRPGFNPSPVSVGFVVDKVALGQSFLRMLRFSLSVSFRHCCILIPL